MGILDRLRRRDGTTTTKHLGGAPLTEKDVREAPANFNRATRRWAGLVRSEWAWDPRALGVPADLPPRYVRRHYKGPDALVGPKTRRQRRHRARILRAMKGKL